MVGAELEPGVLSAGSSSFVVVDFFDFESQATPLLPGVSPAFDFATTFKVCSFGDRDENVGKRNSVRSVRVFFCRVCVKFDLKVCLGEGRNIAMRLASKNMRHLLCHRRKSPRKNFC